MVNLIADIDIGFLLYFGRYSSEISWYRTVANQSYHDNYSLVFGVESKPILYLSSKSAYLLLSSLS